MRKHIDRFELDHKVAHARRAVSKKDATRDGPCVVGLRGSFVRFTDQLKNLGYPGKPTYIGIICYYLRLNRLTNISNRVTIYFDFVALRPYDGERALVRFTSDFNRMCTESNYRVQTYRVQMCLTCTEFHPYAPYGIDK